MSIFYNLRFSFFVILFVCAVSSFGQNKSDSARDRAVAPKGNAEAGKSQDKAGVSKAGGSYLLPVVSLTVVKELFPLLDMASLTVVSVNEKLVQIYDFPFEEKMKEPVMKQLASDKFSLEDYLLYVLPGPVLSDNSDVDASNYQNALNRFFSEHPEAKWYAPEGFDALLSSDDGVISLMKSQVSAKKFVSLSQLPLPKTVDTVSPVSGGVNAVSE